MRRLTRIRLRRIRLGDAYLGVAAVGVLLGAGVTLRRWHRYSELAAQHASQERFCLECADTYRTPDYWNPEYAASAAVEAARQAELRRFYESKW